ncbi:MAG: hypothetical protein ACUVUC_09175 [Thermoguttaceae bacterium]
MSRLRLPKVRSQAASRNRWRTGARRGASGGLKPRRLYLDPLEERTLLALAPLDVEDVLVNQLLDRIPVGSQVYTEPGTGAQFPLLTALPGLPVVKAGQSVACDNDGDFVVTWERTDEVQRLRIRPDGLVERNPDGSPIYDPILNPSTGLNLTDTNVYARYFTDEVQRIILPDEILADYDPNRFGTFSLKYGGNEVQKISITATYQPYTPADFQATIAGSFVLGFDVDGNGWIGPGETTTIFFDELNFPSGDPALNPAKLLQTQLQNLGGALRDVTVVGINPHEYQVQFGDASAGQDQPSIQVISENFTSGFLPAVTVSTVRQPTEVPNIPVSPTDPTATALAMEEYFRFYLAPTISVVPVLGLPGHEDGTVFDVTFTGAWSKKDLPELVITAAWDDDTPANSLMGSAQLGVETLKQPSPEFRVNPEEPDNPFTPLPDLFIQSVPAVAMDADGDFTITWQSEVPGWVNPGSGTDIFARRFSPIGIVEDPGAVRGFVVPGVKAWSNDVQIITVAASSPGPLVGTFRLSIAGQTTEVIDFDSNNLADTARGIESALILLGYRGLSVKVTSGTSPYKFEVTFGGDSAGVDQPPIEYVPEALNATVSIADKPGDLSTFQVNQFSTNPQMNPAIGMDDEGNFAIAWENQGQSISYYNGIIVQRFDRNGGRVGGEVQVNLRNTNEHRDPYVALSGDGYMLVTWSETWPNNSPLRAKLYGPDGSVLLDQTQIAIGQQGVESTAAFNAQNDFVIAWRTFTNLDNDDPFASLGIRAIMYDVNGNVIRGLFRANSASFAPDSQTLWPLTQEGPQALIDADGDLWISFDGYGPDVTEADVDQQIESALISAAAAGATDRQLAELRASLEAMWSPYRGEANGVMFSSWDAAAGTGDPENILASDSPINITRDGHNSRYFIAFDPTTNGGNFALRLWHPNLGGYEDTAAINYNANPYIFARNIRGALRALDRVFDAYRPEPPYLGPVQVRVVSPFEVMQRQGTPWELTDYFTPIPSSYTVFEITFLGSVHDVDMVLSVADNSLTTAGTNEVQILYIDPRDLADQDGWFALRVGANTTGDILFDPNRLGGVAAAIENAIASINTAAPGQPPVYPYAGVQVTFLPGGPPYRFQVVFAGASGGVDQPAIGYAAPQATTNVLDALIYSVTVTQGGQQTAPFPRLLHYSYGDVGTIQTNSSAAIQPDGEFVSAWMQYEEYTGMTPQGETVARTNLYYRQFTETTDTAGPMVTNVISAEGKVISEEGWLPAPVEYLILTFDENMMTTGADSVTNVQNYRLLKNGVEVPGGVAMVHYGMNKAADLGLGLEPTNKWEAVLTLDGNGDAPGIVPLGVGRYEIQALAPIPAVGSIPGRSGLRDRAGNALGSTGFNPDGADFTRVFLVTVSAAGGDLPVTIDPSGEIGTNGRTYPETPGAVAVDSDGDYVVVWTALDPALGRDRVYLRIFDADGTPADLPLVNPLTGEPILDAGGNPILIPDAAPVMSVTPLGTHPGFQNDDQRYASVACDADGDFIVTWTNYRDGEQDVYARRFNAMAGLRGVDSDGNPVFDANAQTTAFRVNTYTANNQKWSNVAMDADGDFVITWSSFGQEQVGSGYDVYARRFDSVGQPLGAEFLVNVTTTGDQRFSSVAMDAQGGFVITWTSNQNGIGDDILVRTFWPDGSPQAGPLQGEIVVNQFTDGNQRYSDVSMRPDGSEYVVTWSSSGQDGSGEGVYARRFSRATSLLGVPRRTYADNIPPEAIPIPDSPLGPLSRTITVTDTYQIADLNVRIDVLHPRASDLVITLIDPLGGAHNLVNRRPQFPAGVYLAGANFQGTIFDDEALVSIAAYPQAQPPFTGTFQPEQPLAALDGQLIAGVWTLQITDMRAGPIGEPAFLRGWSLDVEPTPALGPEFQVNTSILGNQTYGSVAMDNTGGFVVTWSGRGNQPGQADTSGFGGVLFQRYDRGGFPVGGETRVNTIIHGSQWISSIDSDAAGNFVIVWTGVDRTDPSKTAVYSYASANFLPISDTAGPWVSDVTLAEGQRVLPGDVLEPPPPGIQQLKVLFDENLSVFGGTSGAASVINPANWRLERGGTELANAIASVEFQRNSLTRKYEATLHLDGNGLDAGVPPLDPGDYVLTVRDTITDGVNKLDGDFDGTPGTNMAGSGQPGYKFPFSIAAGPQIGAEFRVNTTTTTQQSLAEHLGSGLALEQSTRSVAVDHDGDFVVVWTSYGQDDPSDPAGAGVYLRVFDRNNTPLTPELLVNTYVTGHQRDAAVACDADGDFVVVWESEGQDPDGSWGIYARRYTAMGEPLGAPFRVNSTTPNDQLNPAVAMDDAGNFVIVWATGGQNFSYFNDIRGQLYNYRGERVGPEFRVSLQNVPGASLAAGGTENNPTVAMDPQGNFVVAWDQVITQRNGHALDTVIIARLYDRFGQPNATTPGEFQVNVGDSNFEADPEHDKEDAVGGTVTQRQARNPAAIMDPGGNFTIVWEAYQDNDYEEADGPDSYGIYFRRFNPDGTEDMTADHQANLVITAPQGTVPDPTINNDHFVFAQVNPSIAADADGDYAVVWNGNGAEPNPIDPMNRGVADQDLDGVWIRHFHSRAPGGGPEFVTVQTRVNQTVAGIQEFPSVGMTREGDRVVVWSGAGVGDRHGIFARRYLEPTDTAGPLVTDFTTPSGQHIDDGTQVTETVSFLVVTFNEDMLETGRDSVTDLRNYRLMQNGVELVGGIKLIYYGLNKGSEVAPSLGGILRPTNKFEAVLVLDGDPATPGLEPLPNGHYELVVMGNLRDKAGNRMGVTGYTPNGIPLVSRQFDILVPANDEIRVNPYPSTNPRGYFTSAHGTPVAGDPNGDYVAVWTSTVLGSEGVYARIYSVTWTDTPAGRQSVVTASDQILVTADPTASDASVACDADGDFVVTWSQLSSDPLASWDVYARRYKANGEALSEPFPVNTETRDIQRYSVVAMDAEGDFVIAWQSRKQDGSGYGVYAQRYSPSGNPIGGVDEVQIITFKNNPRGTFALAWDRDQDGIIAADEETADIAFIGSTFAAVEPIQTALAGIGAEVVVQAVSANQVIVRFVGQHGSQDQPQMTAIRKNLTGDPGADVVVTTRFQGVSGEFRVNETTAGDQMWPSIAMEALGEFVISWTSYGQDPDGAGPLPPDAAFEGNIYAKKFISNTAFRGAVVKSTPTHATENPYLRFCIVAADDPGLHVVGPGRGYDGVVRVDVADPVTGGWMGSGTLLTTGLHILTAAHVVSDAAGNPMPPSSVSVTFHLPLPMGDVTIGASQIFVNPNYVPAVAQGGDIAIIVLSAPAPAEAERFDVYRTPDELGRVVDMYGYGNSGTGDTGSVLPFGVKRQGENRYEAMATLLDPTYAWGTDLIAFDFDNGLAENDAFGRLFGMPDLGLGRTREVNVAPGDSGGPSFISGMIAGVHTANYSPAANPADVTPGVLDSSFGEFGLDTRVTDYLPWIDQICVGGSGETLVNQTTAGNQQWSSVALDADGDFVVSWTSYGQDGGTGGYDTGQNGVFARRFTGQIDPATGQLQPLAALPNEFQVNTYTSGNQQYPRVAMDADGDFVITWESYQDPPTPADDPLAEATYGIYAQRYVRPALLGTSPFLGPNGELGRELHISGTVEGDQRFAGIAMSHATDFVIVWSGKGTVPGQADPQGVFYKRFQSVGDDAGPIVADTLAVERDADLNPILRLVRDGTTLKTDVGQMVVDFSENLSTEGGVTGFYSILNPDNWELTRNGIAMRDSIVSIHFGLSQTYTDNLEPTESRKYQAVVTFDADPNTPALEPLGTGEYVLRIRDRVRDIFDNYLDGNYDGLPWGDFRRRFTIRAGAVIEPDGPGDPDPDDHDIIVPTYPIGEQNSPVVACDAYGNFVVVWVEYGSYGDATTEGNIIAQRFNAAGQRQGAEFVVNSGVLGNQYQPDIAMDPFGNFVVVWAGAGENDSTGIFGRRFDAYAVPQGPEFRVNVTTQNVQNRPSVAIDETGDFVVTWNSIGQSQDARGIWGRRYNSQGQALSGEFLVNTYTANVQQNSSVAMDGNGNFVVVWESESQDGVSWGVFGQRFAADGTRIGSEFQVNTYTPSAQYDPQVAMDADGDFVVAWSSFVQDGSGYGVYARRYNRAGVPLGPEFRVNQKTEYWQYQPAVAMSPQGHFVVTWSAFNQEPQQDPQIRDYGIFARIYNPDGSDYVDPATGLPLGEFRINATILGNQVDSNVAMDADGDFVVVWTGPDADPLNLTGVFARVVNISGTTILGTSQSEGFDGWSGGWSTPSGSIESSSTLIVGTPGDDHFEFVMGPTPDQWLVRLNGLAKTIGSRTMVLGFDGRGGYDTVTMTGTVQKEKIELWPDRVILTGTGMTFTTANTEAVSFAGAGGGDEAVFHDSDGDDTFSFRAYPQPSASLVGAGFSLAASGLAKVQAVAGAGNDVAELYDSPGEDTLMAYPTYALLIPSNGSFWTKVSAFESVRAFSGVGGYDTARLYDDRNGADTLVADAAGATLSGAGYRLEANAFRYVHATSTGGYDVATLRDSPGNDTFDAYPGYAAMYSKSFYVRANAFSKVEGESRQGTDLARLYGTSGSDLFEASPTYARLQNLGLDNAARNFRYCTAYANGGEADIARFTDSSGPDNFVGTPTYGIMYGAGYTNRAVGFSQVEGISNLGGGDLARFYDSSRDDTFRADPTSAMLSGPGYSLSARYFRYAYAYATAGGNDTASFADSTGPDVFEGRPTYAAMSSSVGLPYYIRATGFDSVEAVSTGNVNDIARLFDSAGDDLFTAYPTYATLIGTGFSNKATGFRNVYAYAQSGGTDVARLFGSSADDTFMAGPTYGMLSGAEYRNRANYFDQVYATAEPGGNDTATLYDSPGDDLLFASGNLARLSNAQIGFLLEALAFDKVKAISSNPGDTADIRAIDFILEYQKLW